MRKYRTLIARAGIALCLTAQAISFSINQPLIASINASAIGISNPLSSPLVVTTPDVSQSVQAPVPVTTVVTDVVPLSDETKVVVQDQDTNLADGRVTVQLPTEVRLSTINLKVKSANQPIAGDRRLFYVFDISAINSSGQSVTRFSQPLTITLRIADLLGSVEEPVFVAYLNEQTDAWEELNSVKVDAASGDIVFTTNHFSTYGAGVTMDFSGQTIPAAWALKFDDAQASMFDGGLTWAYDFGLPNGPGGVKPDLSLNYNSRRVDGILDFPEEKKKGPTDPSPEAGYGWELDAGEIAWTGVTGAIEKNTGNVERVAWRPSWTLRINGQSLRIVPAENLIRPLNAPQGVEWKMWQYKPASYCGWADDTYRAEDRHDIRIRWICGDEDGSWEVTLPDGTVYLYGTAADSRQTINAAMREYGGPAPRTIRWRLKEIRYPNNVSTVYTYTTDTTIPQCCGAVGPYEYQTHLSEMVYPGTHIVFNWTSGKAPLLNIELYRLQGGGATWSRTRRWNFTYANLASPKNNDGTPRRVLTQIQETAPDGSSEVTLPASTFDYVMYKNKDYTCLQGWYCRGDEWGQAYYYPRLVTINNGYGGGVTASYETPDSGFWHNNNYRLKSREVTDGISPVNGTHYDYSYSTSRGYLSVNDTNSLTVLWQNGFTDAPEIPKDGPNICSPCVGMTGGIFVGYLTSTVAAKALPANGGQLLSQTTDQFMLDHKAVFGRLASETVVDAASSVAQQTVNTWYYTTTQYGAGDLYPAFASYRADNLCEYLHYMSATVQLVQQDVTRDGRTVRTAYAYDTYGNPTETIERGFTDVSGDERTTVRAYVYSTTAWLLNRPISETVYFGVPEEPATHPALQTQQNFFYDGSDVPGALPARGLLTRVDSGAGTTWVTQRTGYDAWANPIVVTDANGNTLRFGYAISGTYLLSQTNALNQLTNYEYYGIDESDTGAGKGPVGSIKRVIDPNRAAVAYAYDAFGRLTGVVKPGDTFTMPTVSTTYFDIATGTLTLTTPLKIQSQLRTTSGCASCTQTSLSYYNGIGQRVQSRSASADANQQIVVDTIYDALGRVSQTFVPTFTTSSTSFARTTGWNTRPKASTQYDALGRAVVVTNTDGTTITSAYLGTTTVVTDANGHRKASIADAYGRLQSVVEYSGTSAYTTTYSYDVLSNLTRVVDALGNTTVITYDALGRKTAMADPDMGVWSYGYDANSNLITQTDALTQTVWFKYDGLNRLVEKRQNGSGGTLLASYGYDQSANGIGQRTSAWNPNATSNLAYDARGRVITQSKTISGTYSFTTTFSYDSADRVVNVTQPNAEVITTTYNSAGQPYSLRGANVYVVSATYSPMGQIVGDVFGNGISTNYTYRTDNFRLQHIQVGSNVLDRQYSYDPIGNITSINDALSGENLSFTYDSLDRLSGTGGAFTETYTYSPIGNMQNKVGITYNYSDTAHKHAVTNLSNGSQYQYDANGNMTLRIEAGMSYTQTWDVDNRLTSVTKGNLITHFYYDADGTLVRKVEPRGQTVYVNGDYEVFYPFIVTITVPSTFTHTQFMPFVSNASSNGACRNTCTYYQFDGKQVAVRTAGTVYWLHADHLNSTSASTDINGLRVSELRYTAYGEVRFSYGDTLTDKRFTSQVEQADISLYQFGARFYDQHIGRFVSADSFVPRPGNSQSLNRYSYSLNNPLKYIDPTGHFEVGDFIWGVVSQWTETNREALPIPVSADERRAVNSLAVDSSEYQAGRVVGALLATVQGIAEAAGGSGGIVGGAAACGTGVGCLIGAPDIALSAGVVVHGTAVALNGANDFGVQLAMFAKRQSAKQIPAITPPEDREGLKRSMQQAGIQQPPGMVNAQAHHNLPWKFKDWFAQAGRGLNVNDAIFGRYVTGNPPGPHQNWSRAYSAQWDDFVSNNPGATRQQVLNFLNKLLSSGNYPSQ